MPIFSPYYPILLRSINTRTLVNYSFPKCLFSEDRTEIISSIVSPQDLYFGVELSSNHVFIIFKDLTHFWFFFHKIYLRKSSIIIIRRYKPSSACHIYFRGSPSTNMNHRNGRRFFVLLNRIRIMIMLGYWQISHW